MPKMADDAAARIFADGEKKTNGHANPQQDLRILSTREFIDSFEPPEYLVDGILQRGYIYALTGTTGHAKSAIALLIAELMGSSDRNAMLGSHKVEKGRVLYFVGENPTDICMRVIGAHSLRQDDDDEDDRVFYILGRVDIAKLFEQIAEAVDQLGGVDLLVVDTSAAYFFGEDELNNVQMRDHARMLRKLTELPGRPCVLVLCHPIKRPVEPEQLLPRGGGGFLAEIDGNLTCWKKDEDDLVELHWTGKMRGPGFEPLTFKMESVKTTLLHDAKGRLLPTVRAVVVGRTEEDRQKGRLLDDEDRTMIQMMLQPNQTLRAIAEALHWVNDKGELLHKRVHRAIERLEKASPKLIKKNRDHWELTDEGKKIAAAAHRKFTAQANDSAQENLI